METAFIQVLPRACFPAGKVESFGHALRTPMSFSTVVQRQRAYFLSGATRPLEFRRAQLHKLREAVEAGEEDLCEALHTDLRKSAYQAYATEVGLVLSDIRHAVRYLPAWMAPRPCRTPWMAWPARGFTLPEPYGVACIIGPWNYPCSLVLSPLIGALAAGNCVVVKPSEFAPRTAATVAGLLSEVFPPEHVSVVQGAQDAAEVLLQERFDSIFFTGSTRVGRVVMAAAARHLTPVTLELGGKCPCIVCADAPLEVTARRIAWGKFLNAGQTCVAPDFVLADRRIAKALVEELKQAIDEFYGGDPRKSHDFGRIVSPRHVERLKAYLGDGQIVVGGQTDVGDLYVAPTILTAVRTDAPVLQDEIFGPILPVVEFDSLEAALNSLRSRPTPLALYLFTRDDSTQQRVLLETRSGGVCLNDTIMHMTGKDLPFGGLGESGLGAYHGQASFDCFSHRRSVMRRSLRIDPKLRYPPPRVSLTQLKRAYRFLLGG